MNELAEMFARAWQHHQAGDICQAEQLYRQVLEANPRHADAWCFLGAACQAQGKLAEAEASYQRAVAIAPTYGSAHNCLGVLRAQQKRLTEAIASFDLALRSEPENPEYHYNLGLALNESGKHEQAKLHFRQALRCRPDYPEAWNDLGSALVMTDSFDAAVVSFQQALRLRPDFAQAHSNLAKALQSQGNLDDAVRHCQQALTFKPDFAEAHHNLGFALLEQGRLKLAMASFERALQVQPELEAARWNHLFCMNYDPDADPDAVFAEHCRWGRRQLSVVSCQLSERKAQTGMSVPPVINGNPQSTTDNCQLTTDNYFDPERRLRVGFVSPDLRNHALTRYFEPVLANLDPRLFETFCYAEVAHPDAVTRHLQSLAAGWRWTCRLTDAEVAQSIRNDRINILVDLAGHTRDSRLAVFAHKPAPIQVSWLGYMNTTGLTTVDYRLTDEVLDPLSGGSKHSSDTGHRTPDSGQIYDTEELVRLPGGICCFAPPKDAPEVTALPAQSRGFVTFGSLNNLFKLNHKVFDLWTQVLNSVPAAKLLMFHDKLTGAARDNICKEFTNRGIDSNRLLLRHGSCAPGYLGVYGEIDISLDVFPCTGGVTTCESLWMGVPVVSLCGVRPASRNSAAILTRIGLEDWAVQTPEEYIECALRWASDPGNLAALRKELRSRMMTTICDAPRFTRELEGAFRTMWRRWCTQGRRN
jgi:protein O-GlcNAc transferase